MPPPITRSHTTSISTSSAAISRRSRRSPHGRTPRRNVRRVLPKARCAARRHVIWLAHWAINCRWPSRRFTLSRFDDVESLDVDSKSLATAAQAEDRAGFAMEVLAARNNGHATLDISDRHKTTSQRFASFSGTIDDRRKTYEATALLAHPDTMLDSATGLTAPTDATIEMNCARSEITAIAGSSNAANDHSQSRVTNAKQSTDSRAQSLGVLAGLIADRVELALDWAILPSTKRCSPEDAQSDAKQDTPEITPLQPVRFDNRHRCGTIIKLLVFR